MEVENYSHKNALQPTGMNRSRGEATGMVIARRPPCQGVGRLGYDSQYGEVLCGQAVSLGLCAHIRTVLDEVLFRRSRAAWAALQL